MEPLLAAQHLLADDLLLLMGWATLERDRGKAAEDVEQGMTFAIPAVNRERNPRGVLNGCME